MSGNETVLDFLPDEPIEVAGMLVNVHKRTLCENAAYYQKMFDVPKLRQIARHLLVYCNANMNKKNG